MDTLQIEKKNAITAYVKADASGKKLLADLLGEKNFLLKATERIKTFEDACEDQGVKPEDVLPFENPADDHQEALNAAAKLFIIAKALNGDWKADFNNSSQYKYYPWFTPGSGSGLSFHDVAYWVTDTYAGIRLCYKDRETASYAGKQFIDIYNKFLL